MQQIAENTDKDLNKTQEKNVENTESKAELRAKRRALQEAQRQAKEKGKLENEKTKKSEQKDSKKEIVKLKKAVNISDSITSGTTAHKKLILFHHLYDQCNPVLTKELSFSLHSAIIRLGILFIILVIFTDIKLLGVKE